MPKDRKKKASSSSSDSDSGPEDRTPAKKQKKTDEDVSEWQLGKQRHVKLTEFKGKWYVDIREFYDAGGELKPTKKGLMLTMEQWQKLKDIVGEVDDAIKKRV